MKKTLKIILIVIGCLLLAVLLFSLIKNLVFKINTKSIDYYEPYGERKRTIFD